LRGLENVGGARGIGHFPVMSFDEVKAAAAALPVVQRERLINYLVCLGVTEDPAWQQTVRESLERHGGRFDAERLPTARVAEIP
jgi:hypothetical protein